jgi:hypothetical protein
MDRVLSMWHSVSRKCGMSHLEFWGVPKIETWVHCCTDKKVTHRAASAQRHRARHHSGIPQYLYYYIAVFLALTGLLSTTNGAYHSAFETIIRCISIVSIIAFKRLFITFKEAFSKTSKRQYMHVLDTCKPQCLKLRLSTTLSEFHNDNRT